MTKKEQRIVNVFLKCKIGEEGHAKRRLTLADCFDCFALGKEFGKTAAKARKQHAVRTAAPKLPLLCTRGREKGQWMPTNSGSAVLYCPKCGEPMNLISHRILPWDGSSCGLLSTPMGCPKPGCGFSSHYIQLVGWAENQAKDVELNRPD